MPTPEENKKITCPRCGTEIEISPATIQAMGGNMVCPNCQSRLQVVGDYAYIPLEGQDFVQEASQQAGQEEQHSEPEPEADPDFDPLMHDAVEYLKTLSAVSVPQLARYFGVDMQRAQLLMDHLEHKGIVGPSRGGAPRSILIDHNQGLGSPYGHSRTLETDQDAKAMMNMFQQQLDQNNQNQTGPDGQPLDPNGQQQPRVHTFGCSCFSFILTILLVSLLISLLTK